MSDLIVGWTIVWVVGGSRSGPCSLVQLLLVLGALSVIL